MDCALRKIITRLYDFYLLYLLALVCEDQRNEIIYLEFYYSRNCQPGSL
jgi:hypothetical protein